MESVSLRALAQSLLQLILLQIAEQNLPGYQEELASEEHLKLERYLIFFQEQGRLAIALQG
ncbi:MAG: hypothetical protein ABR61_00240 [Actinobacteria bacterium BACL2 MAG-120813-bin23]|uniref:Uncharacterized protein n=1 Tax=Actinobacteria bacterium BACL2 MAG-120813-bin23 TaxID=1655569 RepID=A0A0R2Q775_9ACTN|nr:MAG: hypothetical protein ABR61_00240 [Actinobacteria bacterium BACL2 MAG-120813-bin23]